MRVISGNARGHKLKCLDNLDIRPTTDKVKGAIFSIIMQQIVDAQVLDLFAGSGALGIEALSRGAQSAIFVENGINSIDVIKQNLKSTRLESNATVVKDDVLNYLSKTERTFDLIVMDPPYGKGYIPHALEIIGKRKLVAHSGIIVAESDDIDSVPDVLEGLKLVRKRAYGRVTISIYDADLQ
jgi:16S rRNA (guanine(966)-N(2))-methyltransferase RsmD